MLCLSAQTVTVQSKGRLDWNMPGVMVDDQDLERLPSGGAVLGRPWTQITGS